MARYVEWTKLSGGGGKPTAVFKRPLANQLNASPSMMDVIEDVREAGRGDNHAVRDVVRQVGSPLA